MSKWCGVLWVMFCVPRSRSYLTPVRDEEAEAQRKARSRHARQSRRSTQVGPPAETFTFKARQTDVFIFISPLFNQGSQLRTSSHLQLRPGQDNAKQCDKNNNTEFHINKRTVNNTIEKSVYSVFKCRRVGR